MADGRLPTRVELINLKKNVTFFGNWLTSNEETIANTEGEQVTPFKKYVALLADIKSGKLSTKVLFDALRKDNQENINSDLYKTKANVTDVVTNESLNATIKDLKSGPNSIYESVKQLTTGFATTEDLKQIKLDVSKNDTGGLQVVTSVSQLGDVTNNNTIYLSDPNRGGVFTLLQTTALAPDGANIIRDSKSRLWSRADAHTSSPKYFGAVGDGVTDDTRAVRDWFTAGHRDLHGTFFVTDAALVRLLSITSGTGYLLHQGTRYPAGNVTDQFIALRVPSVFPTIHEAVGWMDGKRILGSSGVDIFVDSTNISISTPIIMRCVDGHRITIRGNENDPERCVITVDNRNNTDAFLFTDDRTCAWINGFKILGTTGWKKYGEWNLEIYGSGIRAIGNGSCRVGPKMVVGRMYYGLRTMHGGYINANAGTLGENIKGGGVYVYDSGDVGFHAYAAFMECNAAVSVSAAHKSEGLGFGFCGEVGGHLICEYAVAMDNFKAGFYSLSNAAVWAHGVEATRNMYGVYAIGGVIECNSLGKFHSNIYSNTSHGVYAILGGMIGGTDCWSNKNGGCGFYATGNSTMNLDRSSGNENGICGFLVTTGAVMHGNALIANRNGSNGFEANRNGMLDLIRPSANDNKGHGYYAKIHGKIYCPGMGGVGNAIGLSDPQQCSTNETYATGNLGASIIDAW